MPERDMDQFLARVRRERRARLRKTAHHHYPHRVGLHTCVVCCDSGRTTDVHFAEGPALNVTAPAPVYACYCQGE